jgi:hypothetical protein
MPDYYQTFNISVDGDDIPGNSEEDKAALIKAITDKTDPNYDFKASKNIVADYLTRQSEIKFYGEHTKSLEERKSMQPRAGQTEQEFIQEGGIIGLVNFGTGRFNESTGRFETMSDKDIAEILSEGE